VLHAELTCHREHTHHIKAGHSRATAELSILHKHLEAIKVLCGENNTLKYGVASADELHKTIVRLKGKVEVMHMEHKVWCVFPFIHLCISSVSLMGSIRVRNAVSETPTVTPVSITQSMSMLHVEHMHLLEEHSADCAVLHQHESGLTDVQAHEVDAHATADAFLQAIHAAEDHATG
jgi:mitotic spindle assembly checkpoint protein MAD1